MIVCMAASLLWRKHGHRSAARDLPDLATELALLFVPSRYTGAQGQIKGSFQGHEVRIDPEESRSITVRFSGAPPIALKSYESTGKAPFDWVALYSGDRVFDRFFKTRFAAAALARSLASSSAPSRYLEAFRGVYTRQVKAVTVSSDGVRCELDFGNPPYIPSSAIRVLLPACVALADFIESHLEVEQPQQGVAADATPALADLGGGA